MAAGATMRRFEIALADSDRGVYEPIELRAAQHPSETDRYLVARVIARCLEHRDGVDFTRGLASSDEPAIAERDLRGDLRAWIEVGTPAVERLHKASKTGARVAVYGWKGLPELARDLAARGAHRAAQIELYALDPAFLDGVAAALDRTNRWELSVSGGSLYLGTGAGFFEGRVERVSVPE